MLLASAPLIKLKVIGPSIVRAPETCIRKIALLSDCASNVRVMPAVDVTLVDENPYTPAPRNIWLVDRPATDVVAVSLNAVVNALSKSEYAAATTEPPEKTEPVSVPVGSKPVTVPRAPTSPVTADVPVFEIVPPSSPKELAVPKLMVLPKAGIV